MMQMEYHLNFFKCRYFSLMNALTTSSARRGLLDHKDPKDHKDKQDLRELLVRWIHPYFTG
jgi:hypothetical protein